MYKILINNIPVKIKTGFSMIDRLDEELDSGVIVIPFSSIKEEYLPFSKVVIINDSKRYNYYIDRDDVAIVSWEPLVYSHTITLVEPTKLFEKQKIPSLTFTQPKNQGLPSYTIASMLSRINNVYPLETIGNHAATRLFTIPNPIYNSLNMIAPQLTLSEPTMLQALNEVMKAVNGITKMNEFNVFDYKLYNQKDSLLVVDKVTSYQSSQSSEYYTQSVESVLNNAIVEYENEQSNIHYPAKYIFSTFRSNEQIVNTKNMEMIVNPLQPIYEIKKVLLYGEFIHNTKFIDTIDITSFVYESQLWNLLETPNSIIPPGYGRNKYNTIKYDYQGTSIYGLGIDVPFFEILNRTSLQNLVQTYYQEQDPPIFGVEISSPLRLMYNIEYVPVANTKIKIERTDINEFPTLSSMNTNQAANNVNMQNMGSNMFGVVNRLGNGDITYTGRVSSLDKVWKVGQVTKEGYVVTQIEKQVFSDFVKFIAVLTKNFNRISSFVGVNTEYRQYEIPRTGVERKLNYTEYYEFATEYHEPQTIFVKTLDYLTYLFATQTINPYLVNSVNLKNYNTESGDALCDLILPCLAISIGNTVSFSFGFTDTVSAGNSTTQRVGAIIAERAVKYTDDNGRFQYMQFDLISNRTFGELTYEESLTAGDLLPQKAPFYVVESYVKSDLLYVEKDPSEIIQMNYQLEHVPYKDDIQNIIIGKGWTYYSPFVNTPMFPNKFVVYLSKEKYSQFDRVIAKGTQYTSITIVTEIVNGTFKISLNVPSSININTFSSYAIANNGGGLLVACNLVNKPIIIIPRNKRSG